ncbi:hypothetical protein I4Q36_05665 [Tuanshanicoccus lijuaniae]|uniref:DUF6442 family protein n=1 Tax=Aerococcaceae bacterium zg-1292 TaxID=2774330 RepID=UPI00193781A1|nr:hypothetical protein [Aerococcaceae bacterium zg-1292]MBF6625636.1 hypothetical protein [Aerococcaceae bacterium zg-BR9]MBF6977819.1 hypothetical protein [Aerococcaceae bacterium zg-BR22]QQA36313.1 hypothetical protein I4Q36_05665 [Aerococcaceae bacterium zg-1292]
MNKQKILDLYKCDNRLEDERETYIQLKANNLSIIFSMFTFIVIAIICQMKHLDFTTAKLMFLSVIIGNCCYKYLYDRKNMTFLQQFTYMSFIIGGSILYISYFVDVMN